MKHSKPMKFIGKDAWDLLGRPERIFLTALIWAIFIAMMIDVLSGAL